MEVTFLLGPAGSGKTWRCLAEIRAALKAGPTGPPLLLLAPKQATFQLERQLLADADLPGYTRLQIVSFERLAEFILSECAHPPRLLDEHGRVMVLRALLARLEREKQLTVFHSTARLPGFAQQLSILLRELQQHHLSSRRLLDLAQKPGLDSPLAAKLSDLAAVSRAYLDWLKDHGLEDGNRLLDLAAEALDAPTHTAPHGARTLLSAGVGSEGRTADRSVRAPRTGPLFRVEGLWLDGFAEMTPQELGLLAALVPRCERATLAFCLENYPAEEPSWLSPWAVVAQSFRRCHEQLRDLPGVQVKVDRLPRWLEEGRFATCPSLFHLEQHWSKPVPYPTSVGTSQSGLESTLCGRARLLPSHRTNGSAGASPYQGRDSQPGAPVEMPSDRELTGQAPPPPALRLAVCPNPETEAVLAAQEILRHVRAGGRYRDCAILVRSLDGYHEALRRVLTRYEIPFFLDRREPVAHHALAELTRYGLRIAAFGWQQEDWFGALKSGLLPATDEETDGLENAALEHGLKGPAWREPIRLPGQPGAGREVERLRLRLAGPFLDLERQLTGAAAEPTGLQLANAIRELWDKLEVEEVLQRWAGHATAPGASAVHGTVWEQMQAWLSNLERAFPEDPLPLRQWLPIIEAGLGGLTVGVIPLALDQVLVGAVDRSRNPDLQLALVLGLNESVFPAPPPPGRLLSDADRDELENRAVFLGPNRKLRLGHERYFGYIACTRARQRLVLSWSARDAAGKELNPSLFVDHLKRLFPQLKEERFPPPPSEPPWLDAHHPCELAPALLRNQAAHPAARSQALAALEDLPALAPLAARWSRTMAVSGRPLVLAEPERLFDHELSTSVSALEDYAACPFKFFAARGLRAEERKQFEIDDRERGSFQHKALQEFHLRLQAQEQRWRDVTPGAAQALVRQIGEQLRGEFRDGLFEANDAGRFHAEVLTAQLEKLIAVLVGWAPQYGFDPRAVELDFGLRESRLAGWRLDLGGGHTLLLRGLIDRVDLCRPPAGDQALVAIIDYKSTVRPLDKTKLHHGLQLQLLSYLGALRHLQNPAEMFGVVGLKPAGAFYVGLRGATASASTRTEALEGHERARKERYQHQGRFDAQGLRHFDTRPEATAGDQFKYRLKNDGGLTATSEALPSDKFQQLLDQTEQHLRRIGQEIFAGNAAVAPYRKGSETACEHCKFRPICRFDPWVEPYRVLRPPPKPEESSPPAAPVRKAKKP
jgi:ATP-dependent helicase/nuclease subunit B